MTATPALTAAMTPSGVVRIHRATCKRQGDARPLADVEPS
jgi:hypothetical protein